MGELRIPEDWKFPSVVRSEELLPSTTLFRELFENPGYWYFMLGRAEQWNGTTLSGKRIEFYQVYLGVVSAVFSLWSLDLVRIVPGGKRSNSIERAVGAPGADLGFFETSMLRELPEGKVAAFDDFLDHWLGTGGLKPWLRSVVPNPTMVDSSKPLTKAVGVLNWFVRVAQADELLEDDAQPLFLLPAINLMVTSEKAVSRRRWRRWW